MRAVIIAVTDIGDTASLLAIAIAGGIYLKARGAGRAALFLIGSLLLSGLLIAILKCLFLGCHTFFQIHNIHSPSGHTCESAALLWALAHLMRTQLPAERRFMPLLLLTLLITAIGISRMWLGFHTNSEVLLGGITGFIAFVVARFILLRRHGTGTFDAYALALWALLGAFIAHGIRMPAEDWLHDLLSYMHGHVHIPFC